MLSKMWDTPGGDAAEEQFQADLRAASGIGRAGKGKGRVSVLKANAEACNAIWLYWSLILVVLK